DYPFLSSSMREMWKRWHISLSSFFKDYVYIPLGGSRKGLYKRCKNLLFVFLLSGFWHGANWNYLIWGIYNGVLVVIDTLIDTFFKTFKDKSENVYSVYMFINKKPIVIVRVVLTFIIWTIGMVIFRCENLSTFTSYVYTLTHPIRFNIVTREMFKKVFNGYFALVLIGVIGYATRLWKYIEEKVKNTSFNIVCDIFLILLFIYAIIEMICSGFNPFIYFRF
ncbi:MAG: hypothetical protein MJ151_04610, partial [Lachnospiraceae bacterium]|nr:hypothetical protein [Lachnospiraceae bacterium]